MRLANFLSIGKACTDVFSRVHVYKSLDHAVSVSVLCELLPQVPSLRPAGHLGA